MGKEMRDMIKKENKLCFQHRMERKTEKSFQLSAGRQRLLAETIRELKQEGRLDEEKLAMQHGTTSIYRHSLNVAYTSLWMMERWQIRLEPKSLVRGALLHDYFLYDWHQGFLAPPARLPSPENSAWKCTERLPFKLEGKKYHRTSYVSADTGAASVPRGMDCVSGR